MDAASFTLKLIDKVSPAARAVQASLGRVNQAIGKMRSTGLGKSGVEKGLSNVFSLMEKNAKAREKLEKHAGKKQEGGAMGGAMEFVKGGLIERGIEKVIELGLEAGKVAFEMVTFRENTLNAYKALVHPGVDPGLLFEHTRNLAVGLGLDVMDTAEAYKHFLALQFSPRAADDLIKVGADMRALGADTEEVKGIFLGLGEIKSIGVLHQRQLLMLEQRGISGELIRKNLSEKLGVSVEEVNKRLMHGKIEAAMGIAAIQDAIKAKLHEGHLGEAGKRFAESTITGMLGSIKSKAENVGITLAERITSSLHNTTGSLLTSANGLLGDPAFIDKMGDAVSRIVDLMMMFGDSFGTGFSQAWEALKPVMDILVGGDGSEANDIVVKLGRNLGKLAAFAVVVGVALFDMAAGLTMLGGDIIDGIVFSFQGLIEAIGELILWGDNLDAKLDAWEAGLMDWLSGWGDRIADWFLNIGSRAISGFIDGLKSAGTGIWDAVQASVGNAPLAAEQILDVHSPSKVMRTIGRNTMHGFNLGMGDVDVGAPMIEGIGGMTAGGNGRGFDLSVPRSTAGGTYTITIEQKFDGNGDPGEVARLAAREARREIEGFFRHLGLESG